jgi:aminoglycoside phosphotransferase (APT) family kinase protein
LSGGSSGGIEGRLAAACERSLGGPGRVENLRRLTGGASQQTWSFDWASEVSGASALILRRNTRPQAANLSSATEYALIGAAAAAEVPVPETRFLLSEDDDLGRGYVMARIEGETIPRKILRDAEFAPALPRMTEQAGQILARIHATDISAIEGIPAPKEDVAPAMHVLAQYRSMIDQFGDPHPTFEVAMRWLEDEMPETPVTTLVHGDFRNGNLMVGSEGIRAVLDWELAHIGDPIEDLGWLCVKSWRFGQVDRPVGGFGQIEDLCAAYAAAGGRGATPERVKYWMVYGTLRWGVICQFQASLHRTAVSRSVELAAIGRRVCETEWDLLELIE